MSATGLSASAAGWWRLRSGKRGRSVARLVGRLHALKRVRCLRLLLDDTERKVVVRTGRRLLELLLLELLLLLLLELLELLLRKLWLLNPRLQLRPLVGSRSKWSYPQVVDCSALGAKYAPVLIQNRSPQRIEGLCGVDLSGCGVSQDNQRQQSQHYRKER